MKQQEKNAANSSTRSTSRLLQKPADPRLEDHLALDDDELLVEVELDRLAEHAALELEALELHVVERVGADVDVEDVLHDDRALVELLGDEVRRAPVHADARLERLPVRRGPGEVRQQRRVDVDDAVA